MKQMIKKLACIVALIVFCAMNGYAQEATSKHVVERGETLAAIAQQYGTTVDKLKELNPEAVQFIYVGMELVVPKIISKGVASNQEKDVNESHVYKYTDSSSHKQKNATYDYADREKMKHWKFSLKLSYGIIENVMSKYNVNEAYYNGGPAHVSVGANYYLTRNFYLGAKIGYLDSYVSMVAKHDSNSPIDKYEYKTGFLTMPLELGYVVGIFNNKMSIIPNGGVNMGYCVYNKSKIDDKKFNGRNDFAFSGYVGVKLGLSTFQLGASYVFPINNVCKMAMSEKPYPEIILATEF